MMARFDASKFALAVRVKRGDRSMRDVSAETGVSASTLSRIESGRPPDADTLFSLGLWVGLPLETYTAAD